MCGDGLLSCVRMGAGCGGRECLPFNLRRHVFLHVSVLFPGAACAGMCSRQQPVRHFRANRGKNGRKGVIVKRYYYHTPDGELHGPSDFDFLVREVRYAGLPLGLMVREERSEDWIWIGDIPGAPPEWKLLKERYSGTGEWMKVGKIWKCGRRSRFKWLFSLLLVHGRSSRWEAAIAYGVLLVLAPPFWIVCFCGAAGFFESLPFGMLFALLPGLLLLFFFLFCFIALGVRRFHDAGLHGGWLAAVWLPWIAGLVCPFKGALLAMSFCWNPVWGMFTGIAVLTAPVLFSLLLPEQKRKNIYGEPSWNRK